MWQPIASFFAITVWPVVRSSEIRSPSSSNRETMTAMPRTRSNFLQTSDGWSISMNLVAADVSRRTSLLSSLRISADSRRRLRFRHSTRESFRGNLSRQVRGSVAWRFEGTLLQKLTPTWKPANRAPAATSSLGLLARLAFTCVLLTLLQFFAHAAEADLILHGGKVVTAEDRKSTRLNSSH